MGGILKMEEKLGRQFITLKGSCQDHVKASGHLKAYANPCLVALGASKLGFNLGAMCIIAVCIADDV